MIIKEKVIDKSFLRRATPTAISLWIIGVTVFYLIFSVSHISEGFFPSLPVIHFGSVSLLLDAVKKARLSGSNFVDILYILCFGLIALLIGSRALRWLRVDPDYFSTRIAFAIPLGFGIYSMGVFWIGVAGALYSWVVWAFAGLLGIVSLFEVRPLLREWRMGAYNGLNKTDYIFLPIIVLFVFMPFFASFSPVAYIDVLWYHMGLPKVYSMQHGINYVPYNAFTGWPAGTEMLFLLGLVVSGESLSQLFSYSISLAFLFVIYSFGKRFFSKTVGYLCAVIFLLIPSFLSFMYQPMVDANLTLYAVLGVFAFLIWIENRSDGWIYLSAICCGFAGAIKFQGMLFVFFFFVGFLLTLKRDGLWGRRLLYCMLTIGVILLPWYVRSWVLTGNPLFPFLYNLFGGKNWNDYSKMCHDVYHSWHYSGGVRGIKEFLRWTRWLFFSVSGTSNPIIFFIFLIPGVLIYKDWNRTARYLLYTAIVQYVFIIIMSPQVRYFLPCFALLSFLVAYVITTLWARHILLRVAIVLCLASSILSGLVKEYRIYEEPFFVGLGVISPKACLKTHGLSRVYDLCQWTNKNLPENSKILLWSARGGYFLDKEYVWIDPVWQGVLDFGNISNSPEFLSAVKKLDITHILYFPDELTGTPRNMPHKQFLKLWHQELAGRGKIKLLKQIGESGIYVVN